MKNFLNQPARKLFCILSLVFVCAAIFPEVSAASISFSTDQKDYYFLVNETATFPVTVTSTYPSEISGMLETATTELLSKPDMMMTRSISKGYLRNITPGTSTITVSAGTSAYAETISVDLNFDYVDRAPMQVKLPRVVVHFVTDMSQAGAPGSSVFASSSPGGTGVGSPTTSSITLIQQPIPQAVQQSSLDPGGSSASSSTGYQAGQVSQGNQNTSALQQQLQQASASPDENRTRFLAQLEEDPLVQAANESLTGVKFSRTNLDVNPVTGDAGTFSMTYTGPQGGVVQVTGEVKRGSVQMLTEKTNVVIPAPPSVEANVTFLSYTSQLGASGYGQVSTTILRVPGATSLSAAYADGGGKQAFVNATESGGAVTRVTLEQETGQVPIRTILLAAGILTVLALLVYVVYRRFRVSREIVQSPNAMIGKPASGTDLPSTRHYAGMNAEDALLAAERAFSDEQQREAYGLIGQALRTYISRIWGNGNELTDDEARTILHARNVHLPWADEMLGKCSLIEFAKGSPDPAEFRKFAGTLRDLFRKNE